MPMVKTIHCAHSESYFGVPGRHGAHRGILTQGHIQRINTKTNSPIMNNIHRKTTYCKKLVACFGKYTTGDC
jgi:hypothetical protein